MKNVRALPVWMLAIVLGLALVAMPLVACSAKNSGDDVPQEGATGEAEEAATDDEAGDAEADAEAEPEDAQTGVWVLSKETSTYKSEDYESAYVTTYEFDEQGNTIRSTDDDGENDPMVSEYTVDEDGYMTSRTTDGTTVTYTLEKDDQGRMTKSTSSEGDTTEVTYDADGNIAKQVYTGTAMTMDQDGNMVPAGQYVSTLTFDADGFLLSSNHEGTQSQLTENTHERDGDGRVVKVTANVYQVDAGGNRGSEPSMTTVRTIEYDENGNIARVDEEGELYSYVTVYEYAYVEKPSLATRLESRLKYL